MSHNLCPLLPPRPFSELGPHGLWPGVALVSSIMSCPDEQRGCCSVPACLHLQKTKPHSPYSRARGHVTVALGQHYNTGTVRRHKDPAGRLASGPLLFPQGHSYWIPKAELPTVPAWEEAPCFFIVVSSVLKMIPISREFFHCCKKSLFKIFF